MMKITRDYVHGIMRKEQEPVAVCDSGDIVIFETRDCYNDTIIPGPKQPKEGDPHYDNPATGPLFVKGAMPGDQLKVEILNIDLAPQAVMRTSPTAGAFPHYFTERYFRIFDIVDKEYVQFDEDLKLKLCPMIGVIGTAPAGEGIDTETPFDHGGNMDCNKIGVGTTLYLPVNTEGALLSMGDLHALMGDGEVLICGLEIAGEVTVRVTVLKDQLKAPTLFLVRDGKVMTVQSCETLDEASVKAANAMMEFVTRATKLEPWKSGMLMSLLSNMAVCQIVDPLKTIRVEFPLEILEHYGVQLP
ncbi:MAG: acetamidase/formamidase family protein [Firmicutes bacterium]|nr:acetamidase/formamidase family protein [Bacillota bacterium]